MLEQSILELLLDALLVDLWGLLSSFSLSIISVTCWASFEFIGAGGLETFHLSWLWSHLVLWSLGLATNKELCYDALLVDVWGSLLSSPSFHSQGSQLEAAGHGVMVAIDLLLLRYDSFVWRRWIHIIPVPVVQVLWYYDVIEIIPFDRPNGTTRTNCKRASESSHECKSWPKYGCSEWMTLPRRGPLNNIFLSFSHSRLTLTMNIQSPSTTLR